MTTAEQIDNHVAAERHECDPQDVHDEPVAKPDRCSQAVSDLRDRLRQHAELVKRSIPGADRASVQLQVEGDSRGDGHETIRWTTMVALAGQNVWHAASDYCGFLQALEKLQAKCAEASEFAEWKARREAQAAMV